MTADEIRKITPGRQAFEEFACKMLQEIAAQLSELNYRLSGQGEKVGSATRPGQS